MIANVRENLTPKEKYIDSLKSALYCTTHPLDGFWDLTHEKRGTYAAANTILALALLIRILKLRYTSFLFMEVYWEDLNIFMYSFPAYALGTWKLGTYNTVRRKRKTWTGLHGNMLRIYSIRPDTVSAHDIQ